MDNKKSSLEISESAEKIITTKDVILDKIRNSELNKHDILSLVSTRSQCEDGCVEVELLIQSDEYSLRDEAEERYHNELKKYKCYQEINNYCHINYAIMAYAASNGHLKCIKYLHQNTDVMWHSDLAIVAAENDQFDCLKYIVEEMGDVRCDPKGFKYVKSLKCKQYIKHGLMHLPTE